jgi:hypothetical protein
MPNLIVPSQRVLNKLTTHREGGTKMDDARIQQEINKYKKFKKVDGATYRKVNQFLRKRTYITAREWALARLCTDFRTSGGAEMTFIGQHLPELVPFMEDTYSPQAVNQARNSFKKKVRKSSATFFYGAMCGFFTTDELDDLLFEASEIARFLLEVEGTTLDIDEEIDIEDRITNVMRSVGEAAKTILKSRAEEEGQPEPAPLPMPQKSAALTNSPVISSQTTYKIRTRKKVRNNTPFPDSQSKDTISGKGESLPINNKNIPLEGSLPSKETVSDDTQETPVDDLSVITSESKPTTDNSENSQE